MSRFIDIVGEKYNRWTVLSLDRIENHKTYWLCECECGTQRVIAGSSIKNNSSKSCGCLQKETRKKTANGLAKTRINNIYHNMKNRCYNKNNYRYKNYGKRGIKMCDEWEKSFINFYNWAIKSGYRDNLTIDRINVDGDYEPSNCRWIPITQQYFNKSNNVFFIVNGKKKCLSELCKEYNMPYKTVYARLKRGKNITEALTTPIDIKKEKNH